MVPDGRVFKPLMTDHYPGKEEYISLEPVSIYYTQSIGGLLGYQRKGDIIFFRLVCGSTVLNQSEKAL